MVSIYSLTSVNITFGGKYMKKILLIYIVVIGLIFSSIGAYAVNEEKTNENERDFTHFVLAEFGTTSSCPHCPPVSGYLYDIYNSGDYDFYFLTLNADHEPLANARYWEIPGASGSVPQVFFDGGYSTLIGNYGSKTPYIAQIQQAGSRSVADIDVDVSVDWQGDAEMNVAVSVTNNEGSSYSGRLRAYITEIVSRWYDNSGQKYHYSMIGYAFNENINVGAGDTWSESAIWDGDSHGYGNIEEDNIMVIAAVFDSGSSFVDEIAAATPGGSNPPETPEEPDGPSEGIAGIEYDFSTSTTDGDGDKIYYQFDWGDGSYSNWLGPFNSGDAVYKTYSWDLAGVYNIRVKAKDDNGSSETAWSSPLTIDIVGGPRLDIDSISGGLFRVSSTIKNTGGLEAADISWSITLDGGAIIGKESSGHGLNIASGEEKTINSGFILGFGSTDITVNVWINDGPSDVRTKGGTILLFLIKMNPGG